MPIFEIIILTIFNKYLSFQDYNLNNDDLSVFSQENSPLSVACRNDHMKMLSRKLAYLNLTIL